MKHDLVYHELLADIVENGIDTVDRTGVGTISVFGRQMRFDLSKAFPAVTTKKLAWKSMVGELLWFLEGSGDENRLSEITHGEKGRRTIWTDNANADYWLPHSKYPGDLGRVYGVQWRKWERTKVMAGGSDWLSEANGSNTIFGATVNVKQIDQVAMLVDSLKNNPTNRRMILSAYNVGEIDEMALPPCHMFAQFNVNTKLNRVNCQVYIRSNDMFLGCPFNIASYALLVHMIAQVSGREVGELIITIGDAHVYKNHIDEVYQQLDRTPYDSPQLKMNSEVSDIDSFKMSDFELVGYEHHPAISAPMAV